MQELALTSDSHTPFCDSPRTRAALRYFLYGTADRLSVERVEALANGFQNFRDLMAPVGSEQIVPASSSMIHTKPAGVDPATRQALELVFAAEGSYLQELLLTEVGQMQHGDTVIVTHVMIVRR